MRTFAHVLDSSSNYTTNINVHIGRLQSARITARQGSPCVLRTAVPVSVAGVNARSKPSGTGYVLAFTAEKGKTYCVQ